MPIGSSVTAWVYAGRVERTESVVWTVVDRGRDGGRASSSRGSEPRAVLHLWTDHFWLVFPKRQASILPRYLNSCAMCLGPFQGSSRVVS